MRKLVYLLLILVSFSCKKDRTVSSSSGSAFSDRYQLYDSFLYSNYQGFIDTHKHVDILVDVYVDSAVGCIVVNKKDTFWYNGYPGKGYVGYATKGSYPNSYNAVAVTRDSIRFDNTRYLGDRRYIIKQARGYRIK